MIKVELFNLDKSCEMEMKRSNRLSYLSFTCSKITVKKEVLETSSYYILTLG